MGKYYCKLLYAFMQAVHFIVGTISVMYNTVINIFLRLLSLGHSLSVYSKWLEYVGFSATVSIKRKYTLAAKLSTQNPGGLEEK